MRAFVFAALLGAAVAAPWSRAAGPFVVEDAGILEPGACQLETWARWPRGGHDYWVLPACNPWGRVEYQTGYAQARDGSTRTDLVQLQAKAVVLPLDASPVGVRVLAFAQPQRENTPGAPWRTEWGFVVPVTVPLVPDALSLNLNGAILHGGAPSKTTGAWGASLEWRPGERWNLVAEAFRLLEPRPLYQVGAFYAVVPERFELVATYGNRFGNGSAERWVSFGIQLYTEPFLR